MSQSLANRVRCSLVPGWIIRRLFRGEYVDEGLAKSTEMIGVLDVSIERSRIELREHEHPSDTVVQAIGDRNVYESIFAGDRYCRFRSRSS